MHASGFYKFSLKNLPEILSRKGAKAQRTRIPCFPFAPLRLCVMQLNINPVIIFFTLIIFTSPLSAQGFDRSRGEQAIAELYVNLALDAIENGRWSEAMIVLERGQDYANVSSDIAYMLAMVRSRFNRPRFEILQPLRQALGINNWSRFSAQEALLFEARYLVAVKSYRNALDSLNAVSVSPESSRLRLLALRFGSAIDEYFDFTIETMNRFPRETEPVRIFLDYLKAEDRKGTLPGPRERQIFDLVERRLPALIADDPELAWMAAPFMRDTEAAGRLVAAYRAVNEPVMASIPMALNFGLADEAVLMEELFSIQNRNAGIDIELLDEIWDLLGTEGRDIFRRNLLQYTGVIFSDDNSDGIPEAVTIYQNGMPVSFSYDFFQSRTPELMVNFNAGSPAYAFVDLPEEGADNITISWERYPAAFEAELGAERFIFRPFEFFYAPLQFREYPAQVLPNILFPQKDQMTAALTRRVLIANSHRVERPSSEFPGAIEIIELDMSIPVRAMEYFNNVLISETGFRNGRPVTQRVDLDFDGRLETVRTFRRASGAFTPPEALLDYERIFDYAQSDWTGDGIYEIQYF